MLNYFTYFFYLVNLFADYYVYKKKQNFSFFLSLSRYIELYFYYNILFDYYMHILFGFRRGKKIFVFFLLFAVADYF